MVPFTLSVLILLSCINYINIFIGNVTLILLSCIKSWGVVWVVCLNPLNLYENVLTQAVSDLKLWWTYIANKHYMNIVILWKTTVVKSKKNLIEESLFPVLNALLISFLKKLKSDHLRSRALGKYKFKTIISDLFSILVSIIANFKSDPCLK